MKKTTKIKALALMTMMTIGMVLPMTMNAQDGFFRGGDELITRDETPIEVTGGITNQQFGQETPVGSGLLIMVAAGAGYALLKKKED